MLETKSSSNDFFYELYLEYKYTYKQIWDISYPLILGGVAQTIINVSDTIFLGRLDEIALGASAIAGLYYVTFFMLGIGFSIGTQIIIAKLNGEKNYKQIGEVVSHSFVFMMSLATILFLTMFFGSTRILRSLVHSESVLEASLEFIRYRSIGIYAGFLVLVARSFFSGIGVTKMIGYTTFISASCNILLNYALVFGNLGLPKMEIAGSGLASSIAEILAALFAIIYAFKFGNLTFYGVSKKFKFNKLLFYELLKTSFPLMLQVFIALWSWFVFFLIVEKMGERQLAISNLTRNIYMLLMICLMGFSSATNTIISNLLGQKKNNEIFIVLKKILFLSFSTTLIIVILNLLFSSYTLSIFTNNDELIKQTIGCIYVISGSTLFFSVSYILLSAVSGSGNTVATLIIEVVTLLFYLFATYLFAIKFKTSIELVWCTEFVYFIVMGIISYLYIKRKILNAN